MEKFTQEESKMLLQLLDQLQVKPTAPDALKSVQMVQSTARKIEALTEGEKGKAGKV
jgi:hypothetical protein